MSYLAGFHAKTSQPQEKGLESLENALACGQKWQELLKRLNLSLSLLKTPRCCGPEDLEPSSKTLPKWGMMQGGECWELGTLVRPISVTECGSWPTPSANKTTSSGKLVTADGAPWTGAGKPHSATTGKPVQTALLDKVLHWPTPTRRDWKGANAVADPELRGGTKTRQKWATPQARDWKGPQGRAYKNVSHDLPSQVKPKPSSKGQLNPDWVEWLMGWPINWTRLKDFDNILFDVWYETSEKTHRESVYPLWWSYDPAEVEKRKTGLNIQEQKILFNKMLRPILGEAEQESEQECREKESAKAIRSRKVRDLPLNQECSKAPHRRESSKQFQSQHPDTLSSVPCSGGDNKGDMGEAKTTEGEKLRCLRSHIQAKEVSFKALWESAVLSETWEKVSRVEVGVENRADRLKSIGNGQVPAVAATAFRILSEGLT